jgi:desulfoferrodoxin (superoxide reductase-like protein)
LGKVVFSDITETSRVMDDCYLKKIPVKGLNIEEQKPFIKKANIMLNLNKELHEKTTDFISWIKLTYNPKKINTKLKTLYKLSEQDFFEELKKQKVKLDYNEYTNLKKGWQELKDLHNKIDDTDREIDNMVFDLYGLTTEERKIVLES